MVANVKWAVVLAMLMILALEAPAGAALKVLPEEQSRELEEIALECVAVSEGIDIKELRVSEAWVRELRGLGKDVYMMVIQHGAEEYYVAVAVGSKAFLRQEEVEALIEADSQQTPSDAVYTTGIILDEADAQEPPTTTDPHPVMVWIAGGVLFLGLGALVFYHR